MITALITGLIGIAMLVAFLGFMLVWVKAIPLIIIVVLVVGLLIYDFVQTLRAGESGALPHARPRWRNLAGLYSNCLRIRL